MTNATSYGLNQHLVWARIRQFDIFYAQWSVNLAVDGSFNFHQDLLVVDARRRFHRIDLADLVI